MSNTEFVFRKAFVGEKRDEYIMAFVSAATRFVNEAVKTQKNDLWGQIQDLQNRLSFLQEHESGMERQARTLCLALTYYGRMLAKGDKKHV